MAKKNKNDIKQSTPQNSAPDDSRIKMNYLNKVVAEYQDLNLRLDDMNKSKKTTIHDDNTVHYLQVKITAAENNLRNYANDNNILVANAALKAMKQLSLPSVKQSPTIQSHTSLLDQRFLNGAEKEYQDLLAKKANFIENLEKAKSSVKNLDEQTHKLQDKLNAMQLAGDKSGKPQDMIDAEKRETQFQKTLQENNMKEQLKHVKQYQIAQETVETKLDNLRKNIGNLVKNKEPTTKTLAKKVKKALVDLDKKFNDMLKEKLATKRPELPFNRQLRVPLNTLPIKIEETKPPRRPAPKRNT